MNLSKWKIAGGLTAWAALVLAVQLFAAEMGTRSVRMAWDHSPSAEVVAYKIYYGTNGTNFPYSQTYPYTNEGTVTNLTIGLKYFFAAVAMDTNRIESEYSNILEYQIPPEPVTTPTNGPTEVKDFVLLKVQ